MGKLKHTLILAGEGNKEAVEIIKRMTVKGKGIKKTEPPPAIKKLQPEK